MTIPAVDLDTTTAPHALHDRAMDNLRYIRETMERSASFTHVSGAGGVVMGLLALSVAFASAGLPLGPAWLGLWMGTAGVSLGLSTILMARKSRAAGTTLLTGAGRKFLWNLIPALFAGVLLTAALARTGTYELLPGVWLLLYGVAVVTGGSYSVRPVPVMGTAFMALGGAALVSPATWGTVYMAAGFGLLHIGFGAVIWRRHGG
jgi:hypothetical protein